MKSELKKSDPEIFKTIQDETRRQAGHLEMIASENFVSEAVLEAQGSALTNKYAEGYPGKRYYGGCQFVDVAEQLAIDRAKKLFGAEHANVQAHSGTQANIAVYLACCRPGDTIMGMDLSCGGHLSHGHPLNFSGKYFKVVSFRVRQSDELIDYDAAEKTAREHRPKVICVGASSYSRVFDWARFRAIADSVGAIMMADIAHYAGLIAAGLYPSPVPHAHLVTTTTHKTLRGPRGGMVLIGKDFPNPLVEKTAKGEVKMMSQVLDSIVFPGTQGGPLMHVIAAKAVCFGEALKPEFKKYQQQVIANARALAAELTKLGFRIVSGGTDCHMFLVDLRPKNVTGKDAQIALDEAGIACNKNAIPYDPQKPFIASGIRLGTPALTTRGMKKKEMVQIAGWIDRALTAIAAPAALAAVSKEVAAMCEKFPLYKSRI